MQTIYEWLIWLWGLYFGPVDPLWETMDHIFQIIALVALLAIFLLPIFLAVGVWRLISLLFGGKYNE